MSIGTHPELVSIINKIPETPEEKLVDKAVVYPMMKFMRYVDTNFTCDKFRYEITIGTIKIYFYYLLNMNYTGGAGTLQIKFPELNGKTFFARAEGGQAGRPSQDPVAPTATDYHYSTPTQDAVIELTFSGSFSNKSLKMLVIFDDDAPFVYYQP
jgi:hypothetical protein